MLCCAVLCAGLLLGDIVLALQSLAVTEAMVVAEQPAGLNLRVGAVLSTQENKVRVDSTPIITHHHNISAIHPVLHRGTRLHQLILSMYVPGEKRG
jgi:hypothetical protein